MSWNFKTEEDAYRHLEDRVLTKEEILYTKDEDGNLVEHSRNTRETTLKQLQRRRDDNMESIDRGADSADGVADMIAEIKADLKLDIDVPERVRSGTVDRPQVPNRES